MKQPLKKLMKHSSPINLRNCVAGALGLALCAVATLTPSATQAQLIAYDGFSTAEYVSGDSIAGVNGGSSWGGSWTLDAGATMEASSASLTYSSGGDILTTTAGSAGRFAGGSNTSITRDFNYTWNDGDEIWYSFLFQPNEAQGAPRDPFFGFIDESLGLGENNGFGVRNTGTNNDPAADTWVPSVTVFNSRTALPGTLDAGVTYMFVGKATYNATGNDIHELWINPNLNVDAGPTSSLLTGTAVREFSGFGDIDAFFINTGFNTQYAFDEIRIGESFRDVAPFTPVPEPSTGALLMAVGFAGVMMQRRVRRLTSR